MGLLNKLFARMTGDPNDWKPDRPVRCGNPECDRVQWYNYLSLHLWRPGGLAMYIVYCEKCHEKIPAPVPDWIKPLVTDQSDPYADCDYITGKTCPCFYKHLERRKQMFGYDPFDGRIRRRD